MVTRSWARAGPAGLPGVAGVVATQGGVDQGVRAQRLEAGLVQARVGAEDVYG